MTFMPKATLKQDVLIETCVCLILANVLIGRGTKEDWAPFLTRKLQLCDAAYQAAFARE